MNNAKVMVTKEVAEAIESIKLAPNGQAYNIHVIFGNALNTPESPYGTIKRWLSRTGNGGVHEYFQALVNGYTVEKSPEEKVAEYLAEAEDFRADATDGNYYEFCNGRIVGIKQTLDILGIKISGVNA